MSLFEKFSYRQKEKMLVDGRAEKTISRVPLHQVTPNKAHHPLSAEVTSIPETPDSLLPVHPSQKRKQKRRRARISSSSDEAETETVPPVSSVSQQLKGSCSLFSELPVSKRRKKEAKDSQAEAAKPEECEPGFLQGRKWTSGFHSNPKRLFGSSGGGEGNVHLPSSSSCSEGETAPAVSGIKKRKGKTCTYMTIHVHTGWRGGGVANQQTRHMFG